MRYVTWFSCGAASAVAAKYAVEAYDSEVVYCDTMATEHPDNDRFFFEVEQWIGKCITKIKSDNFDTIDDVFMRTRYMAGIAGARCTTEMKKIPREMYQKHGDIHIFGYTADEVRRAEQFDKHNPALQTEWLLIDLGISKQKCLTILKSAGIELPAMYALGFDHNNCLGCVKATSPKYWNRIRELFPEVFVLRATQSRLLGARLVRVKGKRIFLDELEKEDQTDLFEQIECGPVCQSGEQP